MGDALNHSFDDMMIRIQGLPYLEEEVRSKQQVVSSKGLCPTWRKGVCRRSSPARPARYHPSYLASYLQVPQELEVLAARDVMSAPVVKLPEKALRYYHYSLWLHLLWPYTYHGTTY